MPQRSPCLCWGREGRGAPAEAQLARGPGEGAWAREAAWLELSWDEEEEEEEEWLSEGAGELTRPHASLQCHSEEATSALSEGSTGSSFCELAPFPRVIKSPNNSF